MGVIDKQEIGNCALCRAERQENARDGGETPQVIEGGRHTGFVTRRTLSV
jgi:hypothetical protein